MQSSSTYVDKMTATPQQLSNYVTGNHSDVLRDIREPGINLCLWQRSVNRAVSSELSSLRATHLPDMRCCTSSASFDDDVNALLQQQDLDPMAFENWRIDLRLLADVFFSLSEDRDVSLRLEMKDGDGCRRFHVDRMHLRLLCTYHGPGTLWLTDAQVDRAAQENGEPNDKIIRFGEPSYFETFWVGIMKGDAYPGNTGRGLVHRSPPIAGSGRNRVLFCLDC